VKGLFAYINVSRHAKLANAMMDTQSTFRTASLAGCLANTISDFVELDFFPF
jgi:hypothetical protein